MDFELRYNLHPYNAFLTILGEYLEDSARGLEVRAGILAAGWVPEDFPASKIPASKIPEWMETESYFQPDG